MKILLTFLFVVTYAKAAVPSCIPARINGSQILPCGFKEGDDEIDIEDDGADTCSLHFINCCMYEGKCVARDTGFTSTDSKDDTATAIFYVDADKTAAEADKELNQTEDTTSAFIRNLALPGLPFATGCRPPVPFPGNCKITRNEPFVTDPPVNVPYCVRIPCKAVGNAPYDKSLKLCGSQAGCYFDKELFDYREAFGPSVLPGVPVCHLAIRNKFFQMKALDVVIKYQSWNPYFTNCLLRKFDAEIKKGPQGCELLPILDAFFVTPKMAGWSTITSYECALIDGCWRQSRGCFYPVDISNVRVKSGQREIAFKKNVIVYGRPKCQVFDSSTPLNTLKSYHRCLSAGCTVDSSVTNLYYNQLFSVGKCLTTANHWKYWEDVEKGNVGAYNIDSVLGQYGLKTLKGCPGDHSAFPVPTQGCGFAFKDYNGRPCEPPKFAIPKPKNYCPYKPFFVPRFGVLKGKFDGCCDINVCYLPKSKISEMHSGPSMYYSEWSLYTECSATCGLGERKRYRRCVSQDRSLCTKDLEETKSCNLKVCPGWASWSNWTPCPKSCFPGGVRTRTRKCLPIGNFCSGRNEDSIQCNTHVSCYPHTTKPIYVTKTTRSTPVYGPSDDTVPPPWGIPDFVG